MKSRPIIFNGEMVRAILEGRKTQTRRVIKFMKPEWEGKVISLAKIETAIMYSGNETRFYDETGCWTYTRKCPYGWFGDELWVRETWRRGQGGVKYRADQEPYDVPLRWKSPIHLRRVDARLSLRIAKVRVEKLRDISIDDCLKEGLSGPALSFGFASSRYGNQYQKRFAELWDSINAKKGYGWSENPWVWVVEFERVEE